LTPGAQPQPQPRPRPKDPEKVRLKADGIVVIGRGIVGLCTARELQ
jgi:hypothetical protein